MAWVRQASATSSESALIHNLIRRSDGRVLSLVRLLSSEARQSAIGAHSSAPLTTSSPAQSSREPLTFASLAHSSPSSCFPSSFSSLFTLLSLTPSTSISLLTSLPPSSSSAPPSSSPWRFHRLRSPKNRTPLLSLPYLSTSSSPSRALSSSASSGRSTAPSEVEKAELSRHPDRAPRPPRLNHLAIAVPDLAEAAARFSSVLGAQVSKVQHLPEHGVSIVFVQLANTKIELLHPLGESSPIANFLKRNPAGGMHHICVDVEDGIENATSTASSAGARPLCPPKIGAHGKPVVFLHPKDLCGTMVELQQEK